MAGGRDQPVKIVVINTQYVETDARSFKSVVQELTGKDSGGSTRKAKSMSKMMMNRAEEEMMNVDVAGAGADAAAGGSRVQMARNGSILMRDLSFKELDRLLKEMPVDELYGLWSN